MSHRASSFLSVCALAAWIVLPQASLAATAGKPVSAVALYGEPKYGPGFAHFEYVNPDAPKGGEFVQSNEAFLTFDTFNPFTVKGAQAMGAITLMHDSLMTGSLDEPYSRYGLIAETIEIAPDGRTVQFVLRENARFSDGSPITAADIVFSFNTLITKAFPAFRFIYADVEKAEALDRRTVRFSIKSTENTKVPLLLGEFPVLSESYWRTRDFEATTLEIPVTSGPYTIDSFEVGRFVRYKRLSDYWARDLPVTRGMYNFEFVRYEYYRDDDVQFEAFKTGNYDFTREMSAARWATGYNFPAFNDGRVRKLEVPSIQPLDVTTLDFNLRRPMFQDRRVREAINLAFDFESLNKTIQHGLYTRLRSYWQGSPLEAKGLPSAEEMKLLEPFRASLPPELFTQEFTQPVTQGNGASRENLARAAALLDEAGWKVEGERRAKDGRPLAFEITSVQPSLERALAPWIQDLKRIGVDVTLRFVDTAQYANRVNDFDYDAIYIGMATSLTPGSELRDSLSSEAADRKGSGNYSGIKDPAVDALIEHIVTAKTYEEVSAATRALDRVLTFNHYKVLRYGMPAARFAIWDKLKHPEKPPALGLGRMGEVAIALWWTEAGAATPAPATERDDAARDSGVPLWVMIALALALAGMILFVIFRPRRAS